MTDPIKAKIQELCPDVMKPNSAECDHKGNHFCCYQTKERTITLAVVLRAIDKARGAGVHIAISTTGTFMEREVKEVTATPFAKRFLSAGTGWNLEHDNYDQQSEETKQFIGNLLGV